MNGKQRKRKLKKVYRISGLIEIEIKKYDRGEICDREMMDTIRDIVAAHIVEPQENI